MKVWAGVAVIAALTFGAVAAAVSWTPPDPSSCDVLLQQAEYTSDVSTLVQERGCVEPTPGQDLTARP